MSFPPVATRLGSLSVAPSGRICRKIRRLPLPSPAPPRPPPPARLRRPSPACPKRRAKKKRKLRRRTRTSHLTRRPLTGRVGSALHFFFHLFLQRLLVWTHPAATMLTTLRYRYLPMIQSSSPRLDSTPTLAQAQFHSQNNASIEL